jgi:hypothetical protein
MKLRVSIKAVVCLLKVLAGAIAITSSAQAQTTDSICYLQLPNQGVVDLSRWCGTSEAERQKLLNLTPAQRQTKFLRDLYQQFRDQPERKALEQSDPDALIGKANQVCEALKNGTYEPPRPIEEIDPARKIANLEDTLVDRVARQGYCLGR